MTEASSAFSHDPVLIDEVIGALQPRDGGAYIDGTFGAGGYTRAILEAADCRVWAVDRDPSAVSSATALVDEYAGRLTVIEGRFGDMARILAKAASPSSMASPLILVFRRCSWTTHRGFSSE